LPKCRPRDGRRPVRTRGRALSPVSPGNPWLTKPAPCSAAFSQKAPIRPCSRRCH